MKVLWGVRAGDPDWMESVVSECEATFAADRDMASRKGFDRFRITEIDPSQPPDFIRTVDMNAVEESNADRIAEILRGNTAGGDDA